MKKFLLSIVLALMFAVPFMVTAEPGYTATVYQVDAETSTVIKTDSGSIIPHGLNRQATNMNTNFKDAQNCSSCHSVRKTANELTGTPGGDPIGIKRRS